MIYFFILFLMDYHIDFYNNLLYYRFRDLISSGKNINELNFYDLSKIFEYYSCILLTKEYKDLFFHYDDISPDYKENNFMSINDTGIDICNLNDTIVQCKLRKKYLNWNDCSTFFASQNIYCNLLNKTIIKWNNLIITRNDDCLLSINLLYQKNRFIDKTYNIKELIKYISNIKEPVINNNDKNIQLRDYQIECIDLIKNNEKNIIISLPTGTGKNIIIINSLNNTDKYLILVNRCILMYQLYDEIIKYFPKMKNTIQLIGDTNNNFNIDKNITICIYNSIINIKEHLHIFKKI